MEGHRVELEAEVNRASSETVRSSEHSPKLNSPY